MKFPQINLMNWQFDAMQKRRDNPMWGDKESDTKTVLQASILKVVSALVCPVLTVYVIGVFTSSPSCFKYSLCPEFWCESYHYRWWLGGGGGSKQKKEHNYCHLFSSSCYWQPTLLPCLINRWTQHINLNQIHTYAYQFCFGQFYPFQISLCVCCERVMCVVAVHQSWMCEIKMYYAIWISLPHPPPPWSLSAHIPANFHFLFYKQSNHH